MRLRISGIGSILGEVHRTGGWLWSARKDQHIYQHIAPSHDDASTSRILYYAEPRPCLRSPSSPEEPRTQTQQVGARFMYITD
jgi:hypothetical protein